MFGIDPEYQIEYKSFDSSQILNVWAATKELIMW
jgi:hypothetical protein